MDEKKKTVAPERSVGADQERSLHKTTNEIINDTEPADNWSGVRRDEIPSGLVQGGSACAGRGRQPRPVNVLRIDTSYWVLPADENSVFAEIVRQGRRRV